VLQQQQQQQAQYAAVANANARKQQRQQAKARARAAHTSYNNDTDYDDMYDDTVPYQPKITFRPKYLRDSNVKVNKVLACTLCSDILSFAMLRCRYVHYALSTLLQLAVLDCCVSYGQYCV
jgi:hypothetical protein